MQTIDQTPLFKQACYANGQWVTTAETIAVQNPASQECIGTIPSFTVEQVNECVEHAHQAMKSWSALTAKQRAKIMLRWFNLIEEHADELALIMTQEQGKPLKEARGEILYAASFIEWFAEEGKRVYGETIPQTVATNRLTTIKQPVGVCSAITPWNFPAAMITRKAAPALAAGCSFIVKPATETPFTALALAELADQAGIPAGVFNVVTGPSRALGEVLTQHEKISKFSFTGSTPVGRVLQAQCSSTMKKTSMELGGNAPFIVFEDADIEKAVAGGMAAKFRNGGQTCVCVNRFYVHTDVYDQFVIRFAEHVRALKVGDGMAKGVDIGPMITTKAIMDMTRLLDDALEKGAKELACADAPQGNNYFAPRVLVDVNEDMAIVQEEIFGPIATIIRFDSEEDVIRQANDTIYGLAAYFFSNDVRRVYRVAEALESGMIGINTGLISNEVAPFGGVKQSGLGKEGSRYGIEDYLKVKYLCVDIA